MSRKGGLATGTPGKLVTLESIILKKNKRFPGFFPYSNNLKCKFHESTNLLIAMTPA